MKLFRYRAHLETELFRQEKLYNIVIGTKDRVIEWQADEIKRLRAKLERIELAMTPAPKPGKGAPKAKEVSAEGESSWNVYLARYMKEQEEADKKEKQNVSVENRAGIHESSGGDAGGPDGGPEEPTGTTTFRPA